MHRESVGFRSCEWPMMLNEAYACFLCSTMHTILGWCPFRAHVVWKTSTSRALPWAIEWHAFSVLSCGLDVVRSRGSRRSYSHWAVGAWPPIHRTDFPEMFHFSAFRTDEGSLSVLAARLPAKCSLAKLLDPPVVGE